MTKDFLVPVPHQRLHGTISILEQRPDLPTNVRKVRAVKDIMPLIAYRMCTAQRAPAQLPAAGDHWPCSTGKEWESIRNCINNRNLEIDMGMSRYGSKCNWYGQKTHAKYVHNLAPLNGASLGGTCRPSQTLRC